jgi:hypothetical protein
VIIGSNPLTTPIRVLGRNLNIVIDRKTLDGPADITATPTFSAGADGQEIAVCNVADFPVTFHDSRGPGALKTTLILDCEPGGSVSLDVGQIMMLYYSTTNQMALKWTQRGAIATSVPVISSVVPNEASAVGGDLIAVTGTNLARPTVIVGSGSSTGPIAITEPTATSFKFTMPPRSAGTHNVLVTTGRGASNVLPIKLR